MGRMLKISYKSAWFMNHRLRHAMTPGMPMEELLKGTVEIDETYVGGKVPPVGKSAVGRPGPGSHKVPVVSLVQRGGNKRSMVMETVTSKNLKAAVMEHVEKGANVVSDGFPAYRKVAGDHVHHAVNHSAGEYVRQEAGLLVHTNTVESSFSLLKRGIIGAFHHISKQHLPRYLAEFDFRWNGRGLTDGERMELAVGDAVGKRLTYRQCV